MTRVVTHSPPAATVELQRVVERLLAEYFRRPRAITKIVRRASPYASTFRIEEIDVTFADGSELPLVVKDSTRGAMLGRGQDAQPDFLYDPMREIEVYRQVLPHAPHGTPIHYGHIINPAGGSMIFLERIDGLELRDAATFSMWELPSISRRSHRVPSFSSTTSGSTGAGSSALSGSLRIRRCGGSSTASHAGMDALSAD